MLVNQLEPVLGPAGRYFFAAGLWAAGLTSAVTAPLAAAYAVCGALGLDDTLRGRAFRVVADAANRWSSNLLASVVVLVACGLGAGKLFSVLGG